MKYVMMIFALLMTLTVASASDKSCTESSERVTSEEKLEIKTDVPEFLKGATIIVRLADGRETSVPAEKFKVVPRAQQFIVSKVATEKMLTCSEEARKNRISVLGGNGPTGKLNADRSNQPDSASVETDTGAVGGIQYQYKLNDRLSIGVQGQTNKTGSLLIGVDF